MVAEATYSMNKLKIQRDEERNKAGPIVPLKE